MQTVLDHVSACRSISQKLKGGVVNRPEDPIPSLLVLYEFEAKLVLSQQELRGILERTMHIPFTEAKTMETMAALCIQTQGSGIVTYFVNCYGNKEVCMPPCTDTGILRHQCS